MSLRALLPALVLDTFALDDDRALMRRFAESRDEAAFATVVARHARMVYGVCRRLLRDEHLAEDAFQAVFLVLANHPGRAMSASAVGGWLFGIARRVGLAARRREETYVKRQAKSECKQRENNRPDFDDLLRVLDEELAALPDKYRTPLVACFLEERTLDESAKQLGWSVSTLRRRLDCAKELLRGRLMRRGATLSAGLFAGFLAPSARATVPVRLIEAVRPGSSQSALVRGLAVEVARRSFALKWGAALAVVAAGLSGLALGVDAGNRKPEDQSPPPDLHDVATAPTHRVEGAKWTTVRGHIVFPEGKAIPTQRTVPHSMIKDVAFFGSPRFGDVQVDARTRGIANAVVWLRPDTEDEKDAFPAERVSPLLAKTKSVNRTILATHDGFRPRVTASRAGDRLVFSNPTPIVFTVRYESVSGADANGGGENRRFNVLLPSGQTHTTAPLPGSRASDLFTDNIHPWVRGYVWSFDHPYFAVTDAQGEFTIENAPAGKWRLVVWQEKVGYRNGAKGRLGERIVIAPGDKLKPIAFMSANWDK